MLCIILEKRNKCSTRSSLFKMREHGIQKREMKKIYADRPTCDSQRSNYGSVRMKDCYAVALIFLYGIAASAAVLVFEKLHMIFIRK